MHACVSVGGRRRRRWDSSSSTGPIPISRSRPTHSSAGPLAAKKPGVDLLVAASSPRWGGHSRPRSPFEKQFAATVGRSLGGGPRRPSSRRLGEAGGGRRTGLAAPKKARYPKARRCAAPTPSPAHSLAPSRPHAEASRAVLYTSLGRLSQQFQNWGSAGAG